MAWYWPFKRKPTPARNGGTVQVEIKQSDYFQAAPASVEEYVAKAPRYLVRGDRVRIGSGRNTWTVQFHAPSTDRVLVVLYDSLGRLQTRYVPRERLTIITDFRDDTES